MFDWLPRHNLEEVVDVAMPTPVKAKDRKEEKESDVWQIFIFMA